MSEPILLRKDPEQPYQGKIRYITPDNQRLVVPSDMAPHLVAESYAKMRDAGELPQQAAPLAPPTAPGMLRQAGNDLTAGYQKLRGGVSSAIDTIDSLGGLMDPTRKAAGMKPASATMNPLPPDLTTGAAQTALGVSSKIPGIRELPGILGRPAAAIAGAEVGGAIEGKDQGEIVRSPGVVGAVAGEGLGKGTEVVRKVYNNLSNALYTKDAKKIASSIHELFPSLPEAKTPGELRDLVMSGKGQDAAIKRLMDGYDHVKSEVQRLTGGQDLYVPSLGGRVSFDDARKALTERFRQGFRVGQETATPGTVQSAAQKDAKVEFHEILSDVTNDLKRVDRSGGLVKKFVEERGQFRGAINTLDMLYKANGKSNRLFGPDGETFQTNRLQQVMGGDEAKFKKRLGQETFDRMAGDAFRGAPVGRGDTEGISLGTLMGKANTGLSGGAFFARMPQISIPNYTGSPKPLTMTPEQQTILDLLMQSGLAGANLKPAP